MPELSFFDLKTKKKFTTDKFELVEKPTSRGVTFFAVAISPSGKESWRIVSKKFYLDNA